ncbi:MAG TPA: amidohydrolase family protein [Thermoanaerobaculia bacterium]|nr:amidohydrolase family protein [Thermoanaerobaculia bacterium]
MNPHKIDVHHHVFPPEYVAAMKRMGSKQEGGGIPFPAWSADLAIEMMDRRGIQTAIASLGSPGVWFGDAAAARDLARLSNEYFAGLAREYPTRFGVFASLPLPDTGSAVAEAVYALDTLKCDGVYLLASVADRFLGDPDFEELMQELNRRKAVVFVHPNVHSTSKKLGLAFPEALFEFIADTTRAVLNLAITGTLERYPDILWILSHAGGAVAPLAWRWTLADHYQNFSQRFPQGILTYLRRLYYDTAISPSPFALKPVLDFAGPSQVLFGSDFPYVNGPALTAEIEDLDRLDVFDPASRVAMEQTNALALFPRLASVLSAIPQDLVQV